MHSRTRRQAVPLPMAGQYDRKHYYNGFWQRYNEVGTHITSPIASSPTFPFCSTRQIISFPTHSMRPLSTLLTPTLCFTSGPKTRHVGAVPSLMSSHRNPCGSSSILLIRHITMNRPTGSYTNWRRSVMMRITMRWSKTCESEQGPPYQQKCCTARDDSHHQPTVDNL